MILRYLATSAARNWSMSSLVAATVAPLSCIFWRNSLDCKLSCSAFLSLSSVGRGRRGGGVGQGGDVGCEGGAAGLGRAQRHQLAAFDVRQAAGEREHAELQVVAQ